MRPVNPIVALAAMRDRIAAPRAAPITPPTTPTAGALLCPNGDATAGRFTDALSEMSLEATVALGHRRLAILDLSATGAQPMANCTGTSVVVFNGEIYNHQELRAELTLAGAPGVVDGRQHPERQHHAGDDVGVFPPLHAAGRKAGAEPLYAASERYDGARQLGPVRMAGADASAAAHPDDGVAELASDRGGERLN